MLSLSTLKWPSTGVPRLTATDASLGELPPHEEKALKQLVVATNSVITEHVSNLSKSDSWQRLNDRKHERLRNEILLRFLRYNSLSIDKARNQMLETMKWRAITNVGSLPNDVMYGKQAGIPLVQLTEPTEQGSVLFFSAGEAYSRRDVDYSKQETGAAKMFDFILYDDNGPRARDCSIIVDFSNLCMNNIDVYATKTGVLLYLKYFPDIFQKIMLVNYPKLIYGVWRTIQPLLDVRTKSRVMWLENGEELRQKLGESFDMEQIPDWLGGKRQMDEVTLYNGKTYKSSDLRDRFQ